MIVHDSVDNVCIDMSKISACRILKTSDDVGVLSFESAHCSGYNLYFPNLLSAKKVFELMMISLKNGSSYFEIDNTIKCLEELPFT